MIEQRLNEIETDIKKIKESTARYQNFEQWLKTLTLTGAVIAFFWGIVSHYQAVQQDFRKTFWEERYLLYSQTVELASKIANAASLKEVSEERNDFWVLYTGKMSILEDKVVYNAMVDFGEALSKLERDKTLTLLSSDQSYSLRSFSYSLARACRESLKATWEPVNLDNIPAKKGEPPTEQ